MRKRKRAYGKEAITGYQYEPWHLRYVGTPIAEEIMNRGITLEEYFHVKPVHK
ncbi:D-alanyl-D-alanine carboxypeptidase family protein [Peribacillus cavernae]|nr:D-alanyl-D-alanine carboxypeptidase family protein [Peribacillus cavernae]